MTREDTEDKDQEEDDRKETEEKTARPCYIFKAFDYHQHSPSSVQVCCLILEDS